MTRGEKNKFDRFFSNSTFCSGATQLRKDKVKRECAATNLPQSNDIKSVSDVKLFHGESAFTIFTVLTQDEQRCGSTCSTDYPIR